MNWSRPPPEVFRAVTGQQRAAIWSRVAGSSEEVAAWEQSPHFQTWEELHLYQNVGWWEAVDHEDRPVAIMRLGQAVSQCDTKVSAENLAKAMISLVLKVAVRLWCVDVYQDRRTCGDIGLPVCHHHAGPTPCTLVDTHSNWS
ncbi:TPA: hypothetical protein ACH3X2_003326 [Trebouxia sp. C0005]